MASRDIWKHGSGKQLQDLLSSALLTLLLPGSEGRSIYFASPWMSDFALFDNTSREVAAIFPEFADRDSVRFASYLSTLSVRHDVRVVTARNRTSDAFVERLRSLERPTGNGSLRIRISAEETHEK